MPRFLLLWVGLAGATLLGLGPGQASEGPWCAVVDVGRDSVREICHFRDFESCRREVVSGNRGMCTHNPRWMGRAESHPATRKKARKRHRR